MSEAHLDTPASAQGSQVKPTIRFRFSPEKARAALLWMLERGGRLDLHTILKSCYFADREHLNRYRRPVFGARYRAMRFGPVPLEIYEMAKGEAYWLSELAVERFPWALDGHHLVRTDNEPADLAVLSESDLEALTSGYGRSRALTFDERTAATHGPDWQAARLGWMRYEDMIDDGDDKAELVAYLRATGPFMRL